MAAFDAVASGTTGSDGGVGLTTASLSFTGAAGAALAVFVGYSRGATDISPSTAAVTYNGVSMTQEVTQSPGSTSAKVFMFSLLAACDGAAHNIVVTIDRKSVV
jgi:hypothetical protein